MTTTKPELRVKVAHKHPIVFMSFDSNKKLTNETERTDAVREGLAALAAPVHSRDVGGSRSRGEGFW